MSLPQDTRGKAVGSSFFKPEAGANKVLIVGEAISGYQYWTNGGKVKRSPEVFEETPDIRIRKVKDEKTGEEKDQEEKQQFFWAVSIHNFDTDAIEVWQITQKSIRDELAALQTNEAWGDPTGKYTITIKKDGEGLKTKYTVTPNPADKDTDKIKAVVDAYSANPMDLQDMFFKDE